MLLVPSVSGQCARWSKLPLIGGFWHRRVRPTMQEHDVEQLIMLRTKRRQQMGSSWWLSADVAEGRVLREVKVRVWRSGAGSCRLMAVDFLCDVQIITVQESQFEQRDSWRRCVWCAVNTKGLISRLIRSDSTPLTPSLRNFYKNANTVLFKSVWQRAANYFQPLTKSLW